MSLTTVESSQSADLRRATSLFHGLADRTRLAIIRQLGDGERRVVDLTNALGLVQGTVSGHLACLRGCGLVGGRPEGRQMFYSVAHPEVFDLLSAAERLLALTGDEVQLCPNFGVAADGADADATDAITDEDPQR